MCVLSPECVSEPITVRRWLNGLSGGVVTQEPDGRGQHAVGLYQLPGRGVAVLAQLLSFPGHKFDQ